LVLLVADEDLHDEQDEGVGRLGRNPHALTGRRIGQLLSHGLSDAAEIQEESTTEDADASLSQVGNIQVSGCALSWAMVMTGHSCSQQNNAIKAGTRDN